MKLLLESVADAPDGLDRFAAASEFTAKCHDLHVDRAIRDGGVAIVDQLNDLRPCENATRL